MMGSIPQKDYVRARRGVVLLGALLLCALVVATPAHAATMRAKAAKTAIKALKVQKSKAPVAVYGLLQPVPRNATITEIGPTKYASKKKVKPTVLAKTGRGERVWMFYEDTMPFGQFQRPGRLVLISVRTGRVVLNKVTHYMPLVNGKVPPFLGNSRRYEAKTWRVFYRPWTQRAHQSVLRTATPTGDPNVSAALAHALAAQSTCVVIAGQRGLGVGGEVSARSATFVNVYFNSLHNLDNAIGVWRYAPTSSATFATYLEHVASTQPCGNMLVYIAAQGTASGQPLVMLDTTKVQELRATQLRQLMRSHAGTKWSIVMDASSANRFYGVLQHEPNLATFLAPTGTKHVAFGFLSELKIGKKLVKNTNNPRRIDEFTNDLLYGFYTFTASASEVSYGIAQTNGPDGSLVAWLLGRGNRLSAGAGISDVVGSGGDQLQELHPSSPPPPAPNQPPTATALAITTAEDTPVAVPLAASDPELDAVTYEIVSQPTHGVVTLGAPTMYAPAADYHGDDSFTYRAIDIHGAASAPVTVTLTVTPVTDGPHITADPAATYTEGDPPLLIAPAATVLDVDGGQQITGAAITIDTGYVPSQDQLDFTDTADISGTWDTITGTLTLTGTASYDAYQDALRSISYTNTALGNVVRGQRAIKIVMTNDLTPPVSGSAAVALQVDDINDVPMLHDIAFALDEDTSIAVPFDPTDLDPELDPFLYAIDVPPTHGTITGSGNTRTYVPDPDFNGVDTFTFYATDARGGVSSTQTASITVNPVNDVPVVAAGSGTPPTYVEDGAAVTVDPQIAVSDADGGNLAGATITIASGAQTGDALAFANTANITGAFSGNTLTLSGSAPIADYEAALRAVTFATTNQDPTTSRTIELSVTDGTDTSNVVSETVTITPQNDVPVLTPTATPLPYTELAPATAIDSGLGLTDVDGPTITGATVEISGGFVAGDDTLSFTNTGTISGSYNSSTGVLTLTGDDTATSYQAALRSVTYANSSHNPSASRTITFTTTDGVDAATPVTRAITITPVDDPAVVVTTSAALAYTERDAATVIDGGITISDVDTANLAGAAVSITSGFSAADDALSFATIGAISGTYNPATGVLTLTGADTVANYQAALRTVTFANTSHNPSASRTISFVANDGTTPSLAATRAITITPINEAPTATAGAGSTYAEDAPAAAFDPTLTVDDVDSANFTHATVQITGGLQPGDSLTFANTANISGAWSSGTSTMTLTGTDTKAAYQSALRAVKFVTTNQDPSATRTITFQVNDGSLDSNAATSTVSITASNDAPVLTPTASALTYTENDPATTIDSGITISDADTANLTGASVTISSGFAAAEDTLGFTNAGGVSGSYNTATGVLTLTGTASVSAYQAALRSVTYVNSSDKMTGASRTIRFDATDGTTPATSKTRTVTLIAQNDAPSVADDSFSLQQDSTYDFTFAGTDPDGDTLTFVVASGPTHGAITGSGATRTYTPTAGYIGTDSFTYHASDGTASSADKTFSITVTAAINPTVPAISLTGDQGAIGNTPLVLNDPDDAAPTVAGANKTITYDILSQATPAAVGDTLSLKAQTVTTTGGGTAVIEADGDVTIYPKDGTSCATPSDSFPFTVNEKDGGGSPTGHTDSTVTFTLAGCVWYVKNDAAGGGTGGSTSPVQSIASAVAMNNALVPAPSFVTFAVAQGSGASYGALGFSSGLASNQTVNGEGADLVVDPDGAGTLAKQTLLAATNNYPLFTNAAGDVVTPSSNSQVRGILVDPEGSGSGINVDTSTGVSIDRVKIIDTSPLSSASALVENATTTAGASMSVGSLTIDTPNTAIDLTNSTAFFDPAGTIAVTATRQALKQTGITALSADSEIDSLTTTTGNGGTGAAIDIAKFTTSKLTLGSTAMSLIQGTSTKPALNIAGGTSPIVVPASGNTSITSVGAAAMSVTGLPDGSDFNFDSVTASGASAVSVTFTSANGTSLAIDSGSITSGVATGVLSISNSNGAFTFGAGLSFNNVSAPTFMSISTRTATAGPITFNGPVTDGAGPGGGSLAFPNNAGGSVIFNGQVDLDTNGTAAINQTGAGALKLQFTGGLHVKTTTGAGINAPNADLSITGAGNTISTTTGVPFTNTSAATIPAAGITFQSINSSGAASGIVLANTDTTGFFTVTGSDGASADCETGGAGGCTGGSILSAGSGGVVMTNVKMPVTLQHMNLTGSASNTVAPVWLKNVTGAFTLAHSRVTGSHLDGVYAANSSSAMVSKDLTFANDLIDGNGSTASHYGLHLVNTSGTNSITNSVVSNNFGMNMAVQSISGFTTPTTWSVTNSQFTNNNATSGTYGLSFEEVGAQPYTAHVTGNTISGNRTSQVRFGQLVAATSADISFTGNTVTGAGTSTGSGVSLNFPGNMNARVNISGNTITGSNSSAVSFQSPLAGTVNGGTFDLTFDGNTIGDPAVGATGSGSSTARALDLELNGTSQVRAHVGGNKIYHYFTNALYFYMHGTGTTGKGTMDVTATGNTIAQPDNAAAGSSEGMVFSSGGPTNEAGTMCVDVGGAGALANSFAGSRNSTTLNDAQFTRGTVPATTTTMNFAGWDGTTPFATYITNRNTGSPLIGSPGVVAAVGPASCAQPTPPS